MTRQQAVEKAFQFEAEFNRTSKHDFVTTLYNSVCPLPRGYKLKDSDEWCAAFITAIGAAYNASDVILPECSCYYMLEKYRSAGLWVEYDAFVPSTGDIIFYDWNDTGMDDNVSPPKHVGIIVEKLSSFSFLVLEGNKGNKVGRRQMAVNGKYIRGYATPRYEEANMDVIPDWAKEAMEWAVKEDMTDGTHPNEAVTLARLVTILYRYNKKGAK